MDKFPAFPKSLDELMYLRIALVRMSANNRSNGYCYRAGMGCCH
jgi:hypothetical protein